MKQVLQDKDGNIVYLTDERWQHIITRHSVLKNHKQDVLKTIRNGARSRDEFYFDKFYYTKVISKLPFGFTHIEVVVLFRLKTARQTILL